VILLKVEGMLSVDGGLRSKGRKMIGERRKMGKRGDKEIIWASLIIVTYRVTCQAFSDAYSITVLHL
jgi:hypothetical protein